MEALEIFPIECWQSIFYHLDDDGLESVSVVCKDFLTISNILKNSLQVIHPEIGMFSKHLKRLKGLKKINFTQFTGDLKEAILEIDRSEVRLDALDISNPYHLVESLEELDLNSKTKKNLKALNCKGDESLDNNHLVVIANSFPNLEQLKFGDYYNHYSEHSEWNFSDYGVEFLASKLKLLKKIHMSGSHCVSDRSLVALSLNCAFLEAVKVCCCCTCNGGVTETGIGALLRNSPNLEALSIGYIKMDSSQSAINIENSISHAKSLNSLTFFNMDVSDMLLSAIAEAKLPLKKFGLKICNKFTVKGLLTVLSSNYLNKLCILGAKLGDRDRGFLQYGDLDMELLLNGDVSNLTHIDISYCLVGNSTLFRLSTNCPSLTEIRMNYTDFFGHGNVPSSRNHNVQNIYLQHSSVCDERVKQLALLFPNIRVLDLSNCRHLTSKGIEAILKSCKFIRKLILNEYRGAKLVKDNSEFPEVINLEDLDLSRSLIEDKGLSAIAEKCPRLVSLNLKSCDNLTMEGIKNIVRKVSTLKCIYINPYYTYGGEYHTSHDLLEWMLCTGNFASLKKIHVGGFNFTKKHKEFLHRCCFMLGKYWSLSCYLHKGHTVAVHFDW